MSLPAPFSIESRSKHQGQALKENCKELATMNLMGWLIGLPEPKPGAGPASHHPSPL